MDSLISDRIPPVPASEAAAAASAHSRINIPLNLGNWAHLPPEHQEQLQWFHQYILSEGLGYKDVSKALAYDNTVIFRVLKGTYEGNWMNVIRAIRKYRDEVSSLKRLHERRGTIPTVQFIKTCVSSRIDWILTYTLDRAGCSLILGEGGIGKTACLKHWATDNNHGRSVVIECLPIGGAKGLLRQIAERVGVNKNLNTNAMLEAIVRAFNDTRILVLDEIQHHVPRSPKSQPTAIEMARRIKDLSGCGLAMFGTTRCDSDLKAQPYLYEQVMRRTGKPYYLPDTFTEDDVLPIAHQFLKHPTADFIAVLVDWANDRDLGRLNYVVDTLTFAGKCANDSKRPLSEEMVLAGHALREKRSKKG